MAAESFRIMSYNVRYFGHALRGLASTPGSRRGIARALAALDPGPEIVCLQEVDTISLRSRLADRRGPKARTQLEAFMEDLERACTEMGKPLRYQAIYFRAHAYRLRQTPLYTTGLAVLIDPARLHVADHNAHEPERITHAVRWKTTKQTRICAHVRLVCASGRPLHIFNTHLSLPSPFAPGFWRKGPRMGFGKNQLAEARALGAFVHRHAGGDPFVVCGDFNAPPASPVYAHLTAEIGLLGAQETLGHLEPGLPHGFPTAGLMRLRIHLDHLFAGGGIGWLDLEGTHRFGDRAGAFFSLSDHVPLIARFHLPPDARMD